MAHKLTLLLCASIILVFSLLPLLHLPSSEAIDICSSTVPPPLPEYFQEINMGKIIDALHSRHDFTIWCKLLTGYTTGPVLPFYATLFVPLNPSVLDLRHADPADIDPSLMPYHVTPQRLTFHDLLRLKLDTRLPTLLPSKSIIVTNKCRSGFTIDDVEIIQPDIHVSSNFAVHGVRSTFNYSLYGDEKFVPRCQGCVCACN